VKTPCSVLRARYVTGVSFADAVQEEAREAEEGEALGMMVCLQGRLWWSKAW
jgi:hypothetical protein